MEDPETLAGSIDSTQASPPKTDSFLNALRIKRETLDRDVAEYKALKDAEYLRFEEQIRATVQKNPSVDVLAKEQGSNGLHSFESLLLPPNGMEERRKPARKLPTGSMQERLRTENGANLQNIEDFDLVGQPGTKTMVLETLSHEREIEFQGLFTPRFLPLLGGGRQQGRNSSDRPASPPPSALTDHSDGRRDRPTVLSSSATLPATTYDPLHSPPRPSEMSNSAPRPRLLDQRRSSSRSDISITSLRSILRQAKSPRSAKHVLFAIDNIVMSPSTSPITHRTNKTPPIPFSGLRDMPISTVEEKAKAPAETNGAFQTNYNIEFVPEPITQSISASPSSLSHRSYHELVEPTISAGKDDVEDFQDMGQDGVLFSFDDDEDRKENETAIQEKVCFRSSTGSSVVLIA